MFKIIKNGKLLMLNVKDNLNLFLNKIYDL